MAPVKFMANIVSHKDCHPQSGVRTLCTPLLHDFTQFPCNFISIVVDYLYVHCWLCGITSIVAFKVKDKVTTPIFALSGQNVRYIW